jgi:diguanylate cyclase (GGDEF)-like protein
MIFGPARGDGRRLDLSVGGKARVIALTALGTLCCIIVAFAVDSYAWETGTWRWGEEPLNNIIIPLLLAPPFFAFLLNKQRQLAIAHKELMVVASTDALTSCLNRRAFTALVDGYIERIQQAVAEEPAPAEGALLVIDVDHFKLINDTFGHDVGDCALVAIAESIRTCVRETDFVGRMGGEEFSVLLPGVNADRATTIAEHIRTRIADKDMLLSGRQCRVSVSIGGVAFGRPATFSTVYREADQLLYAAKQGGRNRSNVARLPTETRVPVH